MCHDFLRGYFYEIIIIPYSKPIIPQRGLPRDGCRKVSREFMRTQLSYEMGGPLHRMKNTEIFSKGVPV
jgi:hypothetical protein